MKKKITLLTTSVLAIFMMLGLTLQVSAQKETVFQETFTGFEAGSVGGGDAPSKTNVEGSLDEYMDNKNWKGAAVYSAGGAIKVGKGKGLGWVETPIIDLSGNDGAFIVQFKSCVWSGDLAMVKVIISNNGEVSETREVTVSHNNYELQAYECFFTGGTDSTKIKIEGAAVNNGRFFLDDFTVISTDDPSITGPLTVNFGETEKDSTKTKTINLKGVNLVGTEEVNVTIEGDGFSTGVTVITAAELNANEGKNIDITFAPTELKDYTATLTLATEDSTLIKTIPLTGKGVGITFVNTIAELKSHAPQGDLDAVVEDDKIYKLTGEAIVSFKVSYYNQKWIQDATGAILIYDKDAVLRSDIEIGDGLTGLTGKLTNYYGKLEFIPLNDDIEQDYMKNVEPELITLDQLDRDMENELQSKLIRLNGVNFTATGNFATRSYYTLEDNNSSVDSAVYMLDDNLDYIGKPIPTGQVDLIGICDYSRGKNRIVILNEAQGGFPTGIINAEGVVTNVFPNPTNNQCNVELVAASEVTIHSIEGKLMMKRQYDAGTQRILLADYSSGVYIMKITNLETKSTSTVKLIVH